MLVQRVERTVVRMGDANYVACARLCLLARRLGNCTLYYLRHLFFAGLKIGSMSATDKDIRKQYEAVYRAMPSAAAAQRQTQIIYQQFKSFFAALKSFKKHPEKFSGRPRLPNYAETYRTLVIGRNGYRIENGYLIITGGDKVGLQPIKVQCCKDQEFNAKAKDAVCGDLRICCKGHSFVIEVTYRKEVVSANLPEDRALAVDLGLDNIVTCVATVAGIFPLIVKGGALKSINQQYNKARAQIQSKLDTAQNEAAKYTEPSKALKVEAAKLTAQGNVNVADAVMITALVPSIAAEVGALTAKSITLMAEAELLTINGKTHEASTKRLAALGQSCEAAAKRCVAQNMALEADTKRRIAQEMILEADAKLHAAQELDVKAAPWLRKGEKLSRHLADITFKRNNRIRDLMHKVAHIVITYCLKHDLGTIILGYNPRWKQNINLGRRVNQSFVFIPYATLIHNIQYRAEEYGIKVIVREESYTSKASALDFDPMPDSYQEDAKCTFSGKRIKRGLYRTSWGKLINADINGALNIGRKELGDNWLRQSLANGGFVDKPVVIRNLHQKIR